jgi:hypothetical protein
MKRAGKDERGREMHVPMYMNPIGKARVA